MTKEDKIIIDKQNKETLIIWHNKINCSEIVNELPNADEINYDNPKPMKQWTEKEKEEFRNSRSLSIMKYISFIVGEKEILRHHNKDRMNDEEFEDFWRGNYEGDVEAKRRDSIRGIKQVATNHNIDHNLIDWTKSEDDIFEQMEALDIKENNEQ